MRKGFDARDEEYVQKLSLQHEMPVYIVQTSAKLNQKELDKALDICQATNCDTICINAPKITEAMSRLEQLDGMIDEANKE